MNDKKVRVINYLVSRFYEISDEKLDNLAREFLNIEARPKGHPPYGWLLPQTSDKGLMEISETGLNLIKNKEGFRANAYQDPVGIWTIGYGHTATAKPGQTITKEDAEKLLRKEVKNYSNAVLRLVEVSLTQQQFDALTSFVYNVGVNAFAQSTLLELLNQGQYKAAADQFLRWTRAGNQILAGLTKRRQEERELFLS